MWNNIIFYKLEHNNKFFFGKKHLNDNRNKKELNNIINVYNSLNKDKLINFYGYSKKYGLIFEWLDDFKYVKKTKLIVNDITLVDVDIINVNGVEKFIDFER